MDKDAKIIYNENMQMCLNVKTKITEKYPKLFSKIQYFECGPGWCDILDRMCNKLQTYIDKEQEEQVNITNIKNQYGELLIHASTYGMEKADEIIEEAEAEATTTCEFTGLPGKLHSLGSVYHVVCPEKALELKLTPVKHSLYY
jgi:hypothetical protein